jgi:hypothetical protein
MGAAGSVGGFVIPIFGTAASMWCAAGAVVEFFPISLDAASVRPLPAGFASINVSGGDPFLFGFETRTGRLSFADYATTADVVRSHFARFDDKPFAQSEMANFLRDEDLYMQAARRCAELMEKGRKGAGAAYLSNNPFRPFQD